MLFNSYQFLAFFPIVFFIYWGIKCTVKSNVSLLIRNLFLLLASYYFYMCWQPVYALLLLSSTVITYVGALLIKHDVNHKRFWLSASLILNLSILFFYKYYNFFADSINCVFQSWGIAMSITGLDILLPVGISFYVFQALGYTIDVYRGDCIPEKNFFTYALFVSFFPQLVAGPIERSRNLLRQFNEEHTFDYDLAISGFRLMLWGYFLKLCLADRAGLYVDEVFNNLADHGEYSTLVASVMFTIQIYGDFAGYSFIAIGCSRMIGFRLNDNFRRPYFATSITDFWHRWHISLSTWLRDYVYFPLGGSRNGTSKTYRNILITFLISGLWHGANWTFVLWGAIHGLAQCVERKLGWNKMQWSIIPKIVHITITLIIVNTCWILFRANSLTDAISAYSLAISPSDISLISIKMALWSIGIPLMILLVKEVIEENGVTASIEARYPFLVNYVWPTFLILSIGCLGLFEGGQFIYFQF